VLSGRGLCDELITRPEEFLPSVLRRCVWFRNLMVSFGPQHHKKISILCCRLPHYLYFKVLHFKNFTLRFLVCKKSSNTCFMFSSPEKKHICLCLLFILFLCTSIPY
jgi:hypothetical protein